MSFNLKQNYEPRISTNDLDLFINTLITDVLTWCSDDTHFSNNFLPTIFRGYKIIDNWGLDLFDSDNLMELSNNEDIKYLVTYRRDNEHLYKKNCRIETVEYDFSFMIKDCKDGKYLLNVLADTFIEAIIYNKINYDLELSTRVQYSTATVPPIPTVEILLRNYRCVLNNTEFIRRQDTFMQEFEAQNNKINYLSNGITLKFTIMELK